MKVVRLLLILSIGLVLVAVPASAGKRACDDLDRQVLAHCVNPEGPIPSENGLTGLCNAIAAPGNECRPSVGANWCCKGIYETCTQLSDDVEEAIKLAIKGCDGALFLVAKDMINIKYKQACADEKGMDVFNMKLIKGEMLCSSCKTAYGKVEELLNSEPANCAESKKIIVTMMTDSCEVTAYPPQIAAWQTVCNSQSCVDLKKAFDGYVSHAPEYCPSALKALGDMYKACDGDPFLEDKYFAYYKACPEVPDAPECAILYAEFSAAMIAPRDCPLAGEKIKELQMRLCSQRGAISGYNIICLGIY